MSYTYPMWFKFKDGNEETVKFSSLQCGTVIKKGSTNRSVGYFYDDWTPHTALNIWEDVTSQYMNEAPKCQHEVSFDEECSECIKLLNKHPLKNPLSDYYELWEDVEAIDIIEGNLNKEELIGACKFNILKYQLRIGKKDNVEKELQKIKTYQDYLKYLKA